MVQPKLLLVHQNAPGIEILQRAVNAETEFVEFAGQSLTELSAGRTHVALLWNNDTGSADIPFPEWETMLRNDLVVDLLSCDLNDPIFRNKVQELESSHTGLNIRYSLDKTGGRGGNWVMESDNTDVKDIYFTDSIDDYHYTLGLGTSSLLFNNNRISEKVNFLETPEVVDFFNTHDVSMVSCGRKHTAVVTANGDLYMFGNGQNGQLGHGNTDHQYAPKHVLGLSNETIVAVSCGDNYTAVVTASGDLYTFGRGLYGQLGHGNTDSQYVPKHVLGLSNETIVAVSCSFNHTAVVTEGGHLYTFGDGDYGELGHGNTDNKTTPALVAGVSNETVVAVSCGSFHTAVVTANGDLYTFGYGVYGELGHGNTNQQNAPKQVTGVSNETVVAVSCGETHTAVVTASGHLYTFGNGDYGQLGHGNTDSQYVPKHVLGLSNETVVAVSCGWYHTAVVTASGHLYTFGYGYYGQLGHGNTNQQNAPKQVTGVSNETVVAVSCGFHTAVVTEGGDLYTFGRGADGQLGVLIPLDLDIIMCSQSNNHTAVVTASGDLYTFGYGYYGQLGHGNNSNQLTPIQVTGVSNVVSVSCGDNHTAVVTSDNSTHVFGSVDMTIPEIVTNKRMLIDVEYKEKVEGVKLAQTGLDLGSILNIFDVEVKPLSEVTIFEGIIASTKEQRRGIIDALVFRGERKARMKGEDLGLAEGSGDVIVSAYGDADAIEMTNYEGIKAYLPADNEGENYSVKYNGNVLNAAISGGVMNITYNGETKSLNVIGNIDSFTDGDMTINVVRTGGVLISTTVEVGGGALGDPHIVTLKGEVYEMEDKVGAFRMIEGRNVMINSRTRYFTPEEKEEIKEYYVEKTGKVENVANLVTDGVVQEEVFIKNEEDVIVYNFSTKKMMSNGNVDYSVSEGVITVNLKNKEHGNVRVRLCHYANPQVFSGVNVSMEHSSGVHGLLADTYKTSDYELESVYSVTSKKEGRKEEKKERTVLRKK